MGIVYKSSFVSLHQQKGGEMLFVHMLLLTVISVHNQVKATCGIAYTDHLPPNDPEPSLPIPEDIIAGTEPQRNPRKPIEKSPDPKNKPQPNPAGRKKQNKSTFPTKNLHNKFPHQKNYRQY
jgi:hypothetical protein